MPKHVNGATESIRNRFDNLDMLDLVNTAGAFAIGTAYSQSAIQDMGDMVVGLNNKLRNVIMGLQSNELLG